MQDPPDSVDTLEIEFKLKHKIRIFNNGDISLFYKPSNSLVSASKYGLIFVATPECKINVIPVNAILQLNLSDESTRFPLRIIDLPGPASHLSINCDDTLLSVSIRKTGYIATLVYSVTSFLSADIALFNNTEISCSDEVFVLDSKWNPTIPTVYSICKSDGSIDIFDFKKNSSILKTQIPAESHSRCFCWSPKGKQIAVGARSGNITQYKPDLTAVKIITAPPSMGPIISLQWISNYQFVAIYTSPTSENFIIVIDASKIGPVAYTNYDDICYSHGTIRSNHFYFQMLLEWNTLIVASANSSEVGVLGMLNDRWTQFILADNARAELPLSAHFKQDTLPIGLVVDFTFKKSSLPYLLLLSNEGLLFCYVILNTKGNAKSLCYQEEAPPYSDLLFQFFEFGEPPQQHNNLNLNTLADDQVLITTSKTSTLSYGMQSATNRDPVFRKDLELTRITPKATKEEIYSQFSGNGNKCHRRKCPSKMFILIHEACCHLESELNAVLYKARSTPLVTESDSIKVLGLKHNIKMIVKEVMASSELKETKVRRLKQSMIQSWASYEDVKSRFTTYSNSTMTTLTRFQPLNFTYERHLCDMQYLIYYLESQLVHGNQSLDEQWEVFQMSCKETSKLQLPSTEMIYLAMVTHNATLQKQIYIMKDVSTRLHFHSQKKSVTSACISTKLLENQSSIFQKNEVDSQNVDKVKRKRVEKKSPLTTLRKLSLLKTIMKYHNAMFLRISNKNHKDLLTTYSNTSLVTPFHDDPKIISIDNANVAFVPIKEKTFGSVSATQDRYINLKRSHSVGVNVTNSAFTSTLPLHTLVGTLPSTDEMVFNDSTLVPFAMNHYQSETLFKNRNISSEQSTMLKNSSIQNESSELGFKNNAMQNKIQSYHNDSIIPNLHELNANPHILRSDIITANNESMVKNIVETGKITSSTSSNFPMYKVTKESVNVYNQSTSIVLSNSKEHNAIFDVYKEEINPNGAGSMTSKTILGDNKNCRVSSAINMRIIPPKAPSMVGTKYLMQYPPSSDEKHLSKTHATTIHTVSSSASRSDCNILLGIPPIKTSSTSNILDTTLCGDLNTRIIPITTSVANSEIITTSISAEPLFTTKSSTNSFVPESKTVTSKTEGIIHNENQFIATNTTGTIKNTADNVLVSDNIYSSRQSSSLCDSSSVAISTKSDTYTNKSIFGSISSPRENKCYTTEAYTDNMLLSNSSTQRKLTMDSFSISDPTNFEIVHTKMASSTIFPRPNQDNALSNNPFCKSLTSETLTGTVNSLDKECSTAWNFGQSASKSSTCYDTTHQVAPLVSNIFEKSTTRYELNNINNTHSSNNEASFGSCHTNFSGMIPLGTSKELNSGTFGTAPIFGGVSGSGVSTLGSYYKVFGASEPDTSPFLGSTFANLANQNSIGFENSVPNSTAPAFTGGSSFTSWR